MRKLLSKLYHRLPVVRELMHITHATHATMNTARELFHIQREQLLRTLLQQPRYANSQHLAHFEAQVFSQHGEDGITLEMFRRIGTASRRFVEIGAGTGLENNTAILLSQGWSGLWIEGNPAEIAPAEAALAPLIKQARLKIQSVYVTQENIARVLEEAGFLNDVDFLSLDIDWNTYWIWNGLASARPRVMAVEYNAAWPPGVHWVAPYHPEAAWDGQSQLYGASLTAFVQLAESRGYRLVHCDLCGVNAYFVREDLLEDHFPGPHTAENFYEPFRPYLLQSSGYFRHYEAILAGVASHALSSLPGASS